MESLGLKPTKNSGAGWIEKADGQSESIICELKSTDANSYRLSLDDMHTLEYHANVIHKLPLFCVQFINTDDVYLIAKAETIKDIALALSGTRINIGHDCEVACCEESEKTATPAESIAIKSSQKARQKFFDEKDVNYGKGKNKKYC